MATKAEPLYYIYHPVSETEHEVVGPYDLVQLAGMLRQKQITSETLTCLEGKQDWVAFGDRPQYSVAVEMPADAHSKHTDKLREEKERSKSPIPIPSAETMVKLGVGAVGLLLAAVIAYFVSAEDTTTGFCLMAVGSGAALVAQSLILAMVLDEGWIVFVMVLFLPFYDIYYFTSNLHKYLPYFCAKYLGLVLFLAAYAGLASEDVHVADKLRALLGLGGL